jgi:hypothetical protein
MTDGALELLLHLESKLMNFDRFSKKFLVKTNKQDKKGPVG